LQRILLTWRRLIPNLLLTWRRLIPNLVSFIFALNPSLTVKLRWSPSRDLGPEGWQGWGRV